MNDDVRILVISPAPETASRLNGALRSRGIVVQIDWARDARDAKSQLATPVHELIFCDMPQCDPAPIVAMVGAHDPPVPVIAIADETGDELLTRALDAGVRDLVSGNHALHIAVVVRRELAALAAMRAVAAARSSAVTAERERETMFSESGDALAHVEDGIVVNANAAWAELFGDENAQTGTPLMDLFDARARTTLRGALRAARETTLELVAAGAGGVDVPVAVDLRPVPGNAEGVLEVAIRSGRGQRTLAEELERAQREDPDTGLLNRNAFVDLLTSRAERALVLARIDNFARVVEQMGVMGSDAVAIQFASLVRTQCPDDADAGRIEGTMLGITLSGSSREEVEIWCSILREAVGKAVFEHEGRSTPLTASFGVSLPGDDTSSRRLDEALAALRTARVEGGNRIEFHSAAPAQVEAPDAETSDEDWATRIKQALMKGHFRVAMQPIASLHGESTDNNDLLLRLLDPERGEILPGEFLQAAARVGLMTAIDRWVIGHAIETLADDEHRKAGTTLFVRLSDASLNDATMIRWLTGQLEARQLEPLRLTFELSEQQAETRLKDVRALADTVRKLGCGVLLSHFGAGAQSSQLLEHLPLNYVKLDAAMLNSIARDPKRQAAIKALIEQTRQRKILSVAPGIEDANTMAVLWQLGVDFVQGNYLQEAEVVISDT